MEVRKKEIGNMINVHVNVTYSETNVSANTMFKDNENSFPQRNVKRSGKPVYTLQSLQVSN